MTSIAEAKEIKKETAKAILVELADRTVWVPKSVSLIEDGILFVANWFAKKNGLGCFGLRFTVQL